MGGSYERSAFSHQLSAISHQLSAGRQNLVTNKCLNFWKCRRDYRL